MTPEKTKEAAYEVLKTHLGFDKAAADKHMDQYFKPVWDHMDVNKTGFLYAEEINKFMRDMCKPVKENIILE